MPSKPTVKKSPRAARPAAAATPAVPDAPAPVQLEDGTQVAFSVSAWLEKNGMTRPKPVEVGGRVFQFKTTGTIEENVAVAQFFGRGLYKEALTVFLETPSEAEDLVARLQLPFDTVAESRFWGDFMQAVTGVTVGEASAS